MARVGEVEWYGPETGRGSLDDTISHMPGVRRAVESAAKKMGRHAEMLLASHRKTGASRIELEGAPPRLLDWYVYLTDVDPGGEGKGGKNKRDRSAMSIEFGWTDKEGEFHDGLHILGQAMNAAVRKHI